MKITFVMANWQSLRGGVRVLAIYADRLQKRGHQVCIISPGPLPLSLRQRISSLLKAQKSNSGDRKKASHFDNLDISCYTLPHPPPVTDADVADADVVVAAWWETAEWVANLSPSKGAKAYFIQHHELHDYLPVARVAATYSLPLHKITVSQWLADLMKNRYQAQNVDLVPNSVDIQQFYAVPRTKQTIPTVGMMYSTTAWKGSDISLQAFSLAAKKISNLRLIAFGQEKPTPDLPLPTGTEYIYQPPQNKIKDIYASCDVWLFGSRIEGFGLPILEAMACRTPVIGTPAGAAPELLAGGGGILVQPEDPEDMAKAIARIHQLSPEEWRLMSQQAYNTATNYTWEDATDLFEAALYKAINHNNKVVVCN